MAPEKKNLKRKFKSILKLVKCQWLTHVILATCEANLGNLGKQFQKAKLQNNKMDWKYGSSGKASTKP
jgi:hypothetical protein